MDDASSYVDKGSSLGNKYWVGRGNLVIKGCYDYSNSNKEPDSEVERLKMFAAMRLERFVTVTVRILIFKFLILAMVFTKNTARKH